MRRRDIVFAVAALSWGMWLLCNITVMTTWSETSRQMLTLFGLSVASLYTGLDLALAPKTSLYYRIVKNLSLLDHSPETVQFIGVVSILIGLMLGWGFLNKLLTFVSSR